MHTRGPEWLATVGLLAGHDCMFIMHVKQRPSDGVLKDAAGDVTRCLIADEQHHSGDG